MAIVRVSVTNQSRRTFGFRAWHEESKTMAKVRTCDFEDLDGSAQLVFPDSGIEFSAKMSDIVLFQDTSMGDNRGKDVYEGDIVVARVHNMLGSYETVVAEVIYDEENWGYGLDFAEHSGLPLTGELKILRVVGNVCEGIDEKLVEEAYEEEKRNPGGQEKGGSPD